MDRQCLIDLMEDGFARLNSGDFARAEKRFRAVAEATQLQEARENWAICRFYRNDCAGALDVLAPLLKGKEPSPIGQAVAALAQHALGRKDAALMSALAAERDLDRLLADSRRRAELDEEYLAVCTGMIIEVVCELGRYRRAMELYERWPARDSYIAALHAGFAAFSLQQYNKAIACWQRASGIANRDTPDDEPTGDVPAVHEIARDCVLMARLAAAGAMPPFVIDLAPVHDDGTDRASANGSDGPSAAGGSLPALNSEQLELLAALLQTDDTPFFNQGTILSTVDLIKATGEWGLELARRALTAPDVPLEMKLGGLRMLAATGRIQPGENVTLVRPARTWQLTLGSLVPTDDPAEVRKAYSAALTCVDEGRNAEAYRRLQRICRQEWLYPAAMTALATLMRNRGELEDSAMLLHAAEAIVPDDNRLLAGLAATYLAAGDTRTASRYLSRVRAKGEEAGFRAAVKGLREELRERREHRFWDEPELAGTDRKAQNETPISLTVPLTKALKRVEFRWLNSLARTYGLPDIPRRPERESALRDVLLAPANLVNGLATAPADVREVIGTVLSAGGWCKLSKLTSIFGGEARDGMWWIEGHDRPASPIGLARYLGLLYTGRAELDGRHHLVAVIPSDLREPLAAALREAEAMVSGKRRGKR